MMTSENFCKVPSFAKVIRNSIMHEELMYLIVPIHSKNLIVKIPCIHLVFINNQLKLEI